MTMEEVFKAGWKAHDDYLHSAYAPEDADSAWVDYRYKQLLAISGKDVADDFMKSRMAPNPKPENLKCPECESPMKERSSQYGKFWGCMNYPRCKGTRDSEGLSKAERAALKTINSPDHEDVGPDPVRRDSGFTFKKS